MKKTIKIEELETVINKYKTEKSKISIEVKDFNENIIVEQNPNIKVNSASCIKVVIMVAVLKKVQMDELKLDKVIEFKKLDLDDEDGIYNSGKENYTSNEDMYHLYKKLFQEKILNKKLCGVAKNILRKQRLKNASQRYIYEDIEVYHKTGGLEYLNLRNDCGYFVLDDDAYYFGFFMEEMTTEEDASILIGKLFRIIYNHLASK